MYFGDVPITWMRFYTETPPKLVAEPSVIQPLDFARPAEIMTSKAMGEGTIEVDLIESWSQQAWNRLGNALAPLGGRATGGNRACDTILDIVRAVDRSDQGIYIAKLIATPDNTSERSTRNQRSVLYLGAKIIDVQDGDRDVEVSSMEQSIRVTFMYTHRKYQYNNVGGRGYRPSDPSFPRLNTNQQNYGAPNLNRFL